MQRNGGFDVHGNDEGTSGGGVHFGHETKRWDPKMKPYIFGARNGIYIIDLQKTVQLFKEAYQFVRDIAAKGEYILFVGTKKQAQETISEEATRCGMFYVNHRWLGGMLTNFQTIKRSIDRLNKLEAMKNEEIYNLLPKKEILELEKERTRLERSLGGIKNMDRLPGAIFVVDPKKERIAVREARKIGIPSDRHRRYQLQSRGMWITSFREMTMPSGPSGSLPLRLRMRPLREDRFTKNNSRQRKPKKTKRGGTRLNPPRRYRSKEWPMEVEEE